MNPSPSHEKEQRQRYSVAGQAHVFQYFEDLKGEEKASLLAQLSEIPVEQLQSFVDNAQAHAGKKCDPKEEDVETELRPFALNNVGKFSRDYFSIGLHAIASGTVAAVVLAGGQGTRLGFDGPKGMYDIGLPSHKSLFQLICEKILRIQQLSRDSLESETPEVCLYVMTSPMNHEITSSFFRDNKNFGLKETQVKFFSQGVLPCLTLDSGKNRIMMESPSRVALAPDGNGGIYTALSNSGMIKDMSSKGIKYLHVFAIDNALVKPADPSFLGYCIQTDADCGNKVVWKKRAEEKVGVMVLQKESCVSSGTPRFAPCVVEYSDMDPELLSRTDPNSNKLLFGAANICNHFYTMDFIRDTILPNYDNGSMYHIAKKKIPFWDGENNKIVKPTQNNGMKLESFIFDVFPLSKNMAIYEVEREEEFAPVKNASGDGVFDSPSTACVMISDLAKSWIRNAGAKLQDERDNEICEVSPLLSYGGEGLSDIVKKKGGDEGVIKCPFSFT